jgi:general secretion pathway protein G
VDCNRINNDHQNPLDKRRSSSIPQDTPAVFDRAPNRAGSGNQWRPHSQPKHPGAPAAIWGGVGVTLIELIIAMAILSILMSGILPLSYMAYKRSREIELRQNLRIIRKALDDYKKKVDEGRIPKENDDSGYPSELAVLVEGVESTDAVPVIFKFLRRIPRDPMTEDGEWGLRAYADEPGSNIWGGQDVYDIYSQSDEQALDGTYYRDW